MRWFEGKRRHLNGKEENAMKSDELRQMYEEAGSAFEREQAVRMAISEANYERLAVTVQAAREWVPVFSGSDREILRQWGIDA
jgi:fructose-1,6-bisphosphatase